MIVQDIFRVLYSPLKAFEEIAKTPKVKGPLLILLITLLAYAGASYISSSKILLETEKGTGAYMPLTSTDLFTGPLIWTLTYTMFSFFLNWFFYGITFLLIMKLFGVKEGPWRQLFILIGYTFIVTAVVVFVRAILIYTYPTVNFEFETWTKALEGNAQAQVTIFQEYARRAYAFASYFFVVREVWTAALSAVAIHFLREVSWNKALIISVIVSTASLFFRFPFVFL